jgi:hypothetical protein
MRGTRHLGDVAMRKIWLGYFATLLMMTPSLLGQERSTSMTWLTQPDSPAIFVRTDHSLKDFLRNATLKNVSNVSLTGYRIGWVVVYPGGKDKVGLGLPVDVPKGIDPGRTVEVPAQRVSPSFAAEGASAVVFFITDVHSATGTVWKPELEEIEHEARAELTSAPTN